MNGRDVELLRPLWHARSFVQAEDCRQTLKLWLTEGNYYVNNASPNLSLYVHSVDELKKCLSLDAFRFASHAAQTVNELERSNAYTKLTSWRIIQTYYSAYFAAHAILRFFGRSFSHLETGHVAFLKGRCQTEAGYTPVLPSSYYLISLSSNGRNLDFERHAESHKDLWKCFQNLLRELSSEALRLRAATSRCQALSNRFTVLGDALSNRGKHPAGNWLSMVRNEANYKSLHGGWFPFEKSTPVFSDLIGRVKDWRASSHDLGDPTSIGNDRERFFITAFIVVDLTLSIAWDYQKLAEKAGRRSADFSRLLRLSAAA